MRKKIISFLLCLAMTVTMLPATAFDVEAAWDDSYEQDENYIEPVYGLIATQWVDLEWDENGNVDMIRDEKGYPAYREEQDGSIRTIDYCDCNCITLGGIRYWFDYRTSVQGAKTHVMAEDLEVRYFGNQNPREDGINPSDGVIKEGILQNDDSVDKLVDFLPDELGFYQIYYKNAENKGMEQAFTVYVDYPRFGIYTEPERSEETLLLEEYSDSGYQLNCYHGALNEFYLNTYSSCGDREPEEIDQVSLSDEDPMLRLYGRIDRDGREIEVQGKEVAQYVSIEPMEDQEGWYKIKFLKDSFETEDGTATIQNYNLELRGKVTEMRYEYYEDSRELKEMEPYEQGIWMNGTFLNSGFMATTEWGERFSVSDNSINGAVYPNRTMVELTNTEIDKDGKVKTTELTDFSKIKLYRENYEWDEEIDEEVLKDIELVPEDDYDIVIDGNLVGISVYYEGRYRIIYDGVEGYIPLEAFIDNLEYFSTPNRPTYGQRIENCVNEMTVKQGKGGKLYLLARKDDNNAWAVKQGSIQMSVVNENGNAISNFAKLGKEINKPEAPEGVDETDWFGYEIIIDAAVDTDFTIEAVADYNEYNRWSDENGEWHEEKIEFGEDDYPRRHIDVHVDKVKEIAIKTKPAKTAYVEGENFTTAGMVVEATYESGDKEVVTNYTVDQTTALKADTKEITISYFGKTAKQAVSVEAKVVEPAKPAYKDQKTAVEALDGSKVTTTSSGEATIKSIAKTSKKSINVQPTVVVNGVEYKVTVVNTNAFKNATKAKTVTLPNTVTAVKAKAFAKTRITTVKFTIAEGATLKIDKKAFKSSKVKKVQITMSKKATSKEKAAVKKAFKKAGIKEKDIKIKLK